MYQPPFQQPALGQQPYNPQPGSHGPPPAKKPRGNPVITRYPPPPGYKGLVQPQAPYPAPAWQQPGQAYGYGAPAYQGPPQPSYGAPQAYQQPLYPGYAAPQHTPNGYHQPPGFCPPTAQTYPAPPTGWQPQTSPTHGDMYHTPYTASHSAPVIAPSQTSEPPTSGPPHHHQQRSASFHYAQSGSTPAVDGNGDPYPTHFSSGDDEEDVGQSDFQGDCYFGRHPDEINPDLSLGTLTWQPALPVRRPLPATIQEAELEEIAPCPPKPADEESISDYFVTAKREEAFLSVRQTDQWREVQHDLIFRDIPEAAKEIVPMSELLSKYRDRPDPRWTAPERLRSATPTPTPQPSPQLSPAQAGAGRDGPDDMTARNSSYKTNHSTDALDDLEQDLSTTLAGPNGHANAAHIPRPNTHSRTNSVVSQTSHYTEKTTRPRPLPPVRDKAQEDILAALGVTGAPKVVFQTPGPAFGPPSQSGGATAPSSRQNSVINGPASLRVPPPPPTKQPSPTNDLWGASDGNRNNDHQHSRPGSSGSQHTAVGSDFQPNDQDATPRPKFIRTDSRKRRFNEAEDSEADGRNHLPDDRTPKQVRKQQRVASGAYDRRW